MKKFKIVWLILGILCLFDALTAILEKDPSTYKILSFEVPLYGYLIYKVLLGAFLVAQYFRLREIKTQ
jgi:cellulose synthase/poly-beta-1,6-N-acetylglucosamine synthase-like glycosyltransferase